MIRRWVASGAGFLVALLALSSVAVARAADEGPVLHLSMPSATVGSYEVVTGTGFPHGARLQIEICGIGGSSNSCDLQAAVLATADASGAFTVHLRVSEPPTPCPCNVHAAPYSGTAASPVDVAIDIPKLRYMPDAVQPAVGVAKLVDVAVSDDSSPLTQLGAKGSAQVTVTFADLSGGPANDPGVTLVLTHGTKTVGRYPVRWTGDALEVGKRRSLIYDVPLPGGWFRDFSIAVLVGAAGEKPVTARTLTASVRPWGELVVPFALLLGIGFLLLSRRRHYEVVPPLPVREGAPPGRRNGLVTPAPFASVEPATLGLAALPLMAAPLTVPVPAPTVPQGTAQFISPVTPVTTDPETVPWLTPPPPQEPPTLPETVPVEEEPPVLPQTALTDDEPASPAAPPALDIF